MNLFKKNITAFYNHIGINTNSKFLITYDDQPLALITYLIFLLIHQ